MPNKLTNDKYALNVAIVISENVFKPMVKLFVQTRILTNVVVPICCTSTFIVSVECSEPFVPAVFAVFRGICLDCFFKPPSKGPATIKKNVAF